MVDRDPVVAEVAAAQAGDTRALVVDITAADWLDRLTDATAGLDVGLAVANAGVSYVGDYLDLTPEQRRATIVVNCNGTADLAAWALPAMVERGRGGFVTTSSGSALAGTAAVGLYSATKAFAVNLVEAVGWELRDTGVHTLAIVAPSMDTPAFRANEADWSKMLSPPVDPRTVVAGALDALPEGGRWLADAGLEFAAAVPRAERVAMMSEATTAMYPRLYGEG